MTSQHRQIARHTQDEIEDWLITQLAALLDVDAEAIDVRQPFTRYGLGSVQAVGLSGDLEDWLGCQFSATLLWDYPNIEALATYLAREQANASVKNFYEDGENEANELQ